MTMKTYQVRLNDGGNYYWDVEVEANDVKEACDKALDLANENAFDYQTYEPAGSGFPEYVEWIVAAGETLDVPREFAEPTTNLYKAAIDYAALFIEQKRAEEAIMALENIPGLKGLGDLVRGVR